MRRVPKPGPSSQREGPEQGGGARGRALAPAPPRSDHRQPTWQAPALCAFSGVLLAGLGQACSFPWDDYDPRLTSSGTTETTNQGPGGGGTGGIQPTTTTGGMGGTGATTGTLTTGGTGAMGGAGGTGGEPAEPCGKTDVLADDFEDGVTGVPWNWVGDPGAFITEAGGEGIVTLPANSPGVIYGAFQSKRYYDLRSSSVSVKVTSVAAPLTASTFLVVRYDQDNYVEISVFDGKISAVRVINGLILPGINKVYNPTTHLYWRIRQSGNQIHWETAPEGGAWQDIMSVGSDASFFDLSSVRIDIGSRVVGGESVPSEMHFDDVNGEIVTPGKWCPAGTLKDDFEDGSPGRSWLRSYNGAAGGCTLTEETGALVLKAPAGQTSYCALVSSSSYDLTDSAIVVEVPSISDASTTDEVFLRLEVDEDRLEIIQSLSKVDFRQNKGGTLSTLGNMLYSSEARWWRISEAGGTLFFDYSANAMDWSPGASVPNPFPLTAVDVVIGGGTYVNAATAVQAHFDNVNLPP